MKEFIVKIIFDDTNGYKGHGENTAELIKTSIENEMKMSLESDGVIKNGWKVEIVDDTNSITNVQLQKWIEKRIFEEKERRKNSSNFPDKVQKGGKIKVYNDILEYLKQHPIKF